MSSLDIAPSSTPRKTPGLCVNCKLKTAWRPRRLCYSCHGNPEIRARTPALAVRTSRRGVGISGTGGSPAPGAVARFAPTNAAPGTFGKVSEMSRRAALGLPLFHPRDCRSMDGTDPLTIAQLLLPNGNIKHAGRGMRCNRCGRKLVETEMHKTCSPCRKKMAAASLARATAKSH